MNWWMLSVRCHHTQATHQCRDRPSTSSLRTHCDLSTCAACYYCYEYHLRTSFNGNAYFYCYYDGEVQTHVSVINHLLFWRRSYFAKCSNFLVKVILWFLLSYYSNFNFLIITTLLKGLFLWKFRALKLLSPLWSPSIASLALLSLGMSHYHFNVTSYWHWLTWKSLVNYLWVVTWREPILVVFHLLTLFRIYHRLVHPAHS